MVWKRARVDRRSGSGRQPPEGAGAPRPSRGRTLAAIAALTILLLVSLAILFSGAWRHLSLEELRQRRHELTAYVAAHPVLSVEIYVAAYAVLVALSIPGALLMSLSGGYLFGVWEGAGAAVAGASTGAVAMFLVARTAIGDAIARHLEAREGLLSRLQADAREHTFTTLLALRLMPAVPFALVNLLAGVVRMKFAPYVLATVAGIAPSTLIYTWTGEGLHAVFKRSGAVDLHALVRPEVYGPVIALALLASGPLAWRLRRARRPVPTAAPGRA